ncbi:hypothetical protein [Pseudonocardia phyllosphaerae]|uniref:hypothetical protein n=1 Tax=Pseudonocardia phyllosphaerae TaxID=3390502 RepID=UPI0039787D29
MIESNRGVFAFVLLVVSVLLVAFELCYQMLYVGPVPVPLGTLIVVVSLPWLVHVTATELLPTPVGAAAPIVVWFLATLVLGMLGPGGDVLLPATWQSLLLLAAGAAAGLITYRRELERIMAPPERRGPRPGAISGGRR